MKILCLNCRGIGNPAIVHDLKQLLIVTNPDIMFLSETEVRSNEMERIRIRCHMDGCFVVEANGYRGRLALLWKNEVKVTIKNFSNHHVDLLVLTTGMDNFHFKGFYGFAELNLRDRSWDLLRKMGELIQGEWIIGGDFNAILSNAEKSGEEENQVPLWRISVLFLMI
ncbi:hypothetical protein PVK06_035187 [Gossypium arboreum]|uniref:Endonuclease/exonuclease/phosphatase domain-containing protein n=1 Tax=Gossypium arboreum TaxID=29729 RepID=A0ABR0NJ83_GOSAR|nr:hypothetical protein PVK06_035187 [Gossypium arboreum]